MAAEMDQIKRSVRPRMTHFRAHPWHSKTIACRRNAGLSRSVHCLTPGRPAGRIPELEGQQIYEMLTGSINASRVNQDRSGDYKTGLRRFPS